MSIDLIPKRKFEDLFPKGSTNSIATYRTTITNETINQNDVRNIAYFDYRLRIPGGTDALDTDTSDIRIVGNDLHYIDATGAKRAITGTLEGTTGCDPYYIWIESTAFHYIDSLGKERYIGTSGFEEDGFTYTFPFWFS